MCLISRKAGPGGMCTFLRFVMIYCILFIDLFIMMVYFYNCICLDFSFFFFLLTRYCYQ